MRIKKSKKISKKIKKFDIDEVVRISKYLRKRIREICADALNLIIAKKSMKENWKKNERLYK